VTDILCGTTVARKYKPTPEILARLADAGIERIEIAFFDRLFSHRDPVQMREIASAIATSRVACRSVHLDFGEDADISIEDEVERARRVADACYAVRIAPLLGADLAVVHGSDEPITQAERPRRLQNLAGSLRALCDAAATSGVALALELLPRTCLANTCDEALEAVTGLPPSIVGFCVDVNHVNLREDPAAVVRRLGDRILTFHVSDNDGIDERHWFPFDGVIDWPSFMGAVRDIGYKGQFIFETGGSFHDDVDKYLRELRVRFDRLMAL
jgi:sugar phosphate isomerase/epimerase